MQKCKEVEEELEDRLYGLRRICLRHLKGDELIDFISSKLQEREEFYNQAKYVVSASDLTAERLSFYLNLG